VKLSFVNALAREDVAFGIVVARGVSDAAASDALRGAIGRCVAERQSGLQGELLTLQLACRDMLRNGRYKPTGRGKPASEYLVRAATEGVFPQINGLVDANNLVSLEHLVPISLWDVELANSNEYHFRLGRAEERYVFNRSGQELDLEDLIVGAASDGNTPGARPIVNPVKDSLATKTKESTTQIAAAVYCPLRAMDETRLRAVCGELAGWVVSSNPGARTAHGVLGPGQTLELGVA
jgi:DNA/RNA-binding domain of Phe-tRNA-synthetase-like protein